MSMGDMSHEYSTSIKSVKKHDREMSEKSTRVMLQPLSAERSPIFLLTAGIFVIYVLHLARIGGD